MSAMNSARSLKIKKALHILFGSELLKEKYTDNPIRLNSVRDVFRIRARLCHPDRSHIVGLCEEDLNEKFKRLYEAYNYLSGVLKDGKKIIRKKRTVHGMYERRVQNKQNFGFNYRNHTIRFFHRGDLPGRQLRFAEFLYYSRIIDHETYIRSIVWQKRFRPLLGQIGMDFGFLERYDINTILKNKKFNQRFGEVANTMGLIDIYQLYIMLGKQKRYEMPVGKFFLENGILTERKLDELLDMQSVYNSEMRCKFIL